MFSASASSAQTKTLVALTGRARKASEVFDDAVGHDTSDVMGDEARAAATALQPKKRRRNMGEIAVPGAFFDHPALGAQVRTKTGPYSMAPGLRADTDNLTVNLQRMLNYCDALEHLSKFSSGHRPGGYTYQCLAIWISTVSAFFVDTFSQPPTGVQLILKHTPKELVPFIEARVNEWKTCDSEAIKYRLKTANYRNLAGFR